MKNLLIFILMRKKLIFILYCKPFSDISLIYHMIRGQGTIKLYVVYNVLEVSQSGVE